MAKRIIILSIVLLCCSCASPQRMGMVRDPDTGLQYGSIVQKNIVVDSSQFSNKKLKLKIRNTSGDSAFDLYDFKSNLENAYRYKGYEITADDDFGVLLDINIVYSGGATRNMANEFGILGGAVGGAAGSRHDGAGAAIGVVSGITLGAILGSYITEDTYIVVADVNIAIADPETGDKETTITFSSSEKKITSEDTGFRSFRDSIGTSLAVYAGGRNVIQRKIVSGVRQRFIRILSDII